MRLRDTDREIGEAVAIEVGPHQRFAGAAAAARQQLERASRGQVQPGIGPVDQQHTPSGLGPAAVAAGHADGEIGIGVAVEVAGRQGPAKKVVGGIAESEVGFVEEQIAGGRQPGGSAVEDVDAAHGSDAVLILIWRADREIRDPVGVEIASGGPAAATGGRTSCVQATSVTARPQALLARVRRPVTIVFQIGVLLRADRWRRRDRETERAETCHGRTRSQSGDMHGRHCLQDWSGYSNAVGQELNHIFNSANAQEGKRLTTNALAAEVGARATLILPLGCLGDSA